MSAWRVLYIFEYRKEKNELCVKHANPKSRLKESSISFSNEDIRLLKLNIPAECNIPFVKDMVKVDDEGFQDCQTFENSQSY